MKISINLTEEHIKLLMVLRFEKIDERHYGVDNYILWACGLSSIWEDMAAILGYQDKVIAESREDPMGAICEKETQEHLEELDAFFVEHITDMEEILHQFCTEGIKPGKYTCLDNVHLWKYEGEKQK